MLQYNLLKISKLFLALSEQTKEGKLTLWRSWLVVVADHLMFFSSHEADAI